MDIQINSVVKEAKDLIARFKYDLKVLQIKLYNTVYRRYNSVVGHFLVHDP